MKINITQLLLFSTTLGLSIGFNLSANAQSNQTLGQCTQSLIRQYYNRDQALENCTSTLKYQKPSENLGECTQSLIRQYYNRDQASKACTSLLQQQQQNAQNDELDSPNYPPQRPERGGDPQAIADCMRKLMYERRAVCTRRSCARLGSPADNANRGFGGWQWQTVRTDISEEGAARSCHNARY